MQRCHDITSIGISDRFLALWMALYDAPATPRMWRSGNMAWICFDQRADPCCMTLTIASAAAVAAVVTGWLRAAP